MRRHQSRWPAWLALVFAILGGIYSFLGLAMVSSLQPAHYRRTAWIYLGALATMIILGLGAIARLVRAYRRPQQARDDGTP
jgi:heme A synthase